MTGMMLNPWWFAIGGGSPPPPAGIEYVGGRTHTFNGTTGNTSISLSGTLTGGLASSPAANDFVIVTYATESSGDIDLTMVTAGYTEVTDLWGNDSIDVNLAVYTKHMGATPDADVVVGPTTNAGYPGAVTIHVWRGVDLTTPMDVAATTATGGNSGHPNPPAITPTTLGAVIVVCAAAGSLNAGVTLSQSGSELSNFRAAYSDNGDATNNDVTAAMGSKAWSGSGAFDPVALVGNASASLAWAALTLALRPAA